MKLSNKIADLRKSNKMSQEELAEKLNISRQTISRWEMGTTMPDATNILQLSKQFSVTADYLLNDDYNSDYDLPKIKEVKDGNFKQILIFLITLEIMVLLMQFMTTFILQNTFFGFLSFIPFVALIGGFEYAYQKRAGKANETTALFRKHFYQISAWLGFYFPIRFIATVLITFYPRPYSALAFEGIVLGVYIGTSILISFIIHKEMTK